MPSNAEKADEIKRRISAGILTIERSGLPTLYS